MMILKSGIATVDHKVSEKIISNGRFIILSFLCCSPVPEGLKQSNITVVSENEGDGLFSAKVSWPPVPGADSYGLRINGGKSHFINVNNTVSGSVAS